MRTDHRGPIRPATAAFTLLGAAVFAITAGCGSDPGAQPGPSSSATAIPTSLPDGIPLPAGATLAAPVDPVAESAAATGWTAVALAPAAMTATTAFTQLQDALGAAGWSTTKIVSDRGSTTISVRSPRVSPVRFLNATVTAPLPGGGFAITYRFVQLPEPVIVPAAGSSS